MVAAKTKKAGPAEVDASIEVKSGPAWTFRKEPIDATVFGESKTWTIKMDPIEVDIHDATVQVIDGQPVIYLDYFRLKEVKSFTVDVPAGTVTVELEVRFVNPKEGGDGAGS